MPIMLELKAEELAKKQTKIPSQDLASTFFKSAQQVSQEQARYEAYQKSKSALETLRKAQIAYAPTKVPEAYAQATKPYTAPVWEKLKKAEATIKPSTTPAPTLGIFDWSNIAEHTIEIAGYKIKTAYILAGIALLIVLVYFLK